MHLDDHIPGTASSLMPFFENRFLRRSQWALVARAIKGFVDLYWIGQFGETLLVAQLFFEIDHHGSSSDKLDLTF
jgi:hypothetical protein